MRCQCCGADLVVVLLNYLLDHGTAVVDHVMRNRVAKDHAMRDHVVVDLTCLVVRRVEDHEKTLQVTSRAVDWL